MSDLPKSDTRLWELLTGLRDPQSADLATRLAVGHLRQSVRQDAASLTAALAEIYHYYTTSEPIEQTQDLRSSSISVKNYLLDLQEASSLIESGAIAIIAGSGDLLASLPRGSWIGGTTGYFMTAKSHTPATDHLLCSILERGGGCRIAVLMQDALPHITVERYQPGFTYLLLPAFSEVHYRYALEAPGFPGLFDQPIIGWVAGVHASKIGKSTPAVFDGRSGIAYKDAAVALHMELSPKCAASLQMVNRFIQGQGPAIIFPETSFDGDVCTIDGQLTNIAEYMAEYNIDTNMPLVANYAGAFVNVSVRTVDHGGVRFYAPVVAGETYRFAEPRADYARIVAACVRRFAQPQNALACNCISNRFHADLDSDDRPDFVGPVTFGEIAYILLNQTLVVLDTGVLVSSE